MFGKENQNIYLKYFALAIYVSGIYFLFGQSFRRPKKIRKLKISTDRIECNVGDENKNISLWNTWIMEVGQPTLFSEIKTT